jgi:hypothetical protein
MVFSSSFARPSQLYRAILMAHKKHLPPQMKGLGDKYVKNEFRLHKTAKAEQVAVFALQWEDYLNQISMTARAKESASAGAVDDVFAFGRDLPHDASLSEEQMKQLEKLREEASKAGA